MSPWQDGLKSQTKSWVTHKECLVMSEIQKKGLEDVVAGDTAICTVGKEGNDLRYRGYSFRDLANQAIYEEVAYLLLHGKLPTREELNGFIDKIASLRGLSKNLLTVLKTIPKNAHPMDVLRTGVSFMGCEHEDNLNNPFDTAYRLIANLPEMVLAWYHHHHPLSSRHIPSQRTLAGRFLEQLRGKPIDDDEVKAMNCSYILYAEHGFNASTFASRVTTGTESDLYSAICSAIGTLKGPLHGGANEKTMDMLLRFDTTEQALKYVDEALAKKIKIMGFGHRVYKIRDPRSDLIKEHAKRLSLKHKYPKYYEFSEAIERALFEKKKLFPNVDFYSACFYFYLDIPIPLYTPIFAFSRISGWVAHVLEQRADNRLIRPEANYTGPGLQTYVPIEQRK
jgi:2-methylcitrate synthase